MRLIRSRGPLRLRKRPLRPEQRSQIRQVRRPRCAPRLSDGRAICGRRWRLDATGWPCPVRGRRCGLLVGSTSGVDKLLRRDS
eukprot:scaffold1282_cov251-Pinguiococcus_pyrenoidosus.AAC.56